MKIRKNKHVFIRGIIFVLMAAICLSPFESTMANASAYSDLTLSVQDQARSYAYYEAMLECINHLAVGNSSDSGMNDGIVASGDGTATDPANGNWFQSGMTAFVPGASGTSDSTHECNSIAHTALSTYFGYGDGSYYKLLKAMGYTWNKPVQYQWVNTDSDTQKQSDFTKAMKAQGVPTTMSSADKYWLYQNAFWSQCSPKPYEAATNGAAEGKPVSQYTSTTDSKNAKANGDLVKLSENGVVDTYALKYTEPTYTSLGINAPLRVSPDNPAGIILYGNRSTTQDPTAMGNAPLDCSDLITGINSTADAYATALQDFSCTKLSYASGDLQKACVAGVQSKTTGNTGYCAVAYATAATASLLKACQVGSGAPAIDDSSTSGEPSTPPGTATSCVIDGVGWIVCSMANFLASVTDGIYGLIQNLLRVPIINTDTSSGTNGVYNAWLIMRNFANVGFVIGFLIIIFSQITSLGVTNYGVKKTLPRLIVAVILVNVSYWLSAIAVDLSNITGSGIYDIMSGVKDSMNIGISANWGNIIGGLLGGTGIAVVGGAVVVATGAAVIAAGGGMALVFLALPLVLSAVLAVLIAAFVLIARQALVVILIIVSPLAFVALLLPNTEKLFSKWRSALVTLLLLYPIVSIVFGGAQIAGLAIMSTAGSTADPISTELPIVIGQTIMVVPFFILPLLITKFSGNNLSGLVSSMTSKGKGLISGIGGASRKEGRARIGTALNTMKYGENAPKGIIGRGVRRFGRSFDQTKDQRGMADSYLGEQRQSATRARLGDEKFATGAAAGSKSGGEQIASRALATAEAEELKKALQPLVRELAGMDPAMKASHLKSQIAAGGAQAAAALQYSASIGDTDFMRKQIAEADKTGNADLKRQAYEAINANNGAFLAKAPDLVKGSKAAFANVKGADLATYTKDTAKAYMEHIGSLSGDELTTALNGFNSAVEDITKSADLQSKFSGDTGSELSVHAAKLPPQVQAQMHGTAAIQSDGKIR